MIWIYYVHFWDIHFSPQLRVSRAWQRLLGARAGVQDCSREGQTNETSKGYNQTHNCLKLHSYFFLCPKLPDVLSYDKSQLMCFQLLHTASYILSVGIVLSVQLAAGLNCAPKINETRCITEKKIACKTSVAFVERAYPHDLINIPVYKHVKSFCQLVRDQKRNLSKMSNDCQQ